MVDCDARRSFGGNGRWEEWLVLCEVELPWALRPGKLVGRKGGEVLDDFIVLLLSALYEFGRGKDLFVAFGGWDDDWES